MTAPELAYDADCLAFANELGALLVKVAEAGARKALEHMPPHPSDRGNGEILNTRETAALLKVSIATLHRLGLPKHYVGCMPRYLRSEVLAWIAKQKGTL